MKKFGFLIVPLFVALALVLVTGNDQASANTGSVTLGPAVIEVPFGGGTAIFVGNASFGLDLASSHSISVSSDLPTAVTKDSIFDTSGGSFSVTVTVPPLAVHGDHDVTVTYSYEELITTSFPDLIFILRTFVGSATVRVLEPTTFEGLAFVALDGQHGALEAKLDALEVGAGLTVADIAAALAPLATDIGFIEAKLDAQETAIGNLTIDVSNVDGGIGALEAKADALVFDIDDILAAVGPLGLQLDGLAAATSAIEGKLDVQGTDLDDLLVLAFASDDALSALEGKADSLVNEIDDLVTPLFGGIAGQLGELEFATSAIEGKLDALGPQINGKLDALEAKADALVFDIDDILAAVGPLGLKLDNLGLATLAIEGKLDTQGFDLGVANTGITDIQAALAAHDSEGGGLGLAVAALETKLDAQAAELTAQGEQLDEILALLQSFPLLAKGDNGKGK